MLVLLSAICSRHPPCTVVQRPDSGHGCPVVPVTVENSPLLLDGGRRTDERRRLDVHVEEFRRGPTGGSVDALDLPRSRVLNRCYGGGGMVPSLFHSSGGQLRGS